MLGIAKGSFAELAAAREDELVHKPARLSMEQAAALAISGLTALQALRDQAKVRPGQTLLVLGASGGVGSFAVQLARAFRAEVTGVCSATKADLVRSLGADHVVHYLREDVTVADRRYDVIIDIGGNTPLRRLRRVLAPRGTLVIVGGENGGRCPASPTGRVRAMLLSPFVGQKLGTFISSENARDLLALTELVEAGKLVPAVERTFSLSEAPEAIRYVEEGHVRGNVVLTV